MNQQLHVTRYIILFLSVLLCGSQCLVSSLSAEPLLYHGDRDSNPSSHVNDFVRSIIGTVTDEETGDPLIGVNILVKGTATGALSDDEGKFSIEVPDEAEILIFSYIGYATKEVSISEITTVNVALAPEITSLGEVVVVGYGTKKKSNLTGAVDDINIDEEIGQRPVANIQQMLQGAVPNLNVSYTGNGGEPGATNNLNIRGIGTITGDGGSPYILLDGLPITTAQLNSINPNDIESISVLKDAASAAIYGSRGAYGVILITTKKGTAGEKVQVDFSSTIAFASPTVLPSLANSLDFVNAYNQAVINSGAQPMFTEQEIQDVIDFQNGLKDSETEPNETGTNWRYWTDGYANYDWFEEMYKDWAPRQQHRISVNGGSGNTTFYLSGNYFEQVGNLRYGNDQYDRLNFVANVKNQATDWLSFDVSAKYAREDQVMPTGGFGGYDKSIMYHQISRLWPVVPKYGPNGNIVNSDILRIQRSGDSREFINNTILQIGTDIEPIKGWVTRVSYNWNLTNSNYERVRLTNLVELPDGTTSNVGYNPDQIYRSFDEHTNQLLYITSSYDVTVGNHTLGGLVGYEQRLQKSTFLGGSRSELITSNIPTVSTSVGEERTFDALSQFSTQGVFGRLNYSFMDKYLIELNARYDGSSFFREGNRWGFFPSASIGYNLAREGYWAPLANTIGLFKVRASWGQLGNHDPQLAGLYQELLPASNSTWLLNGSRPAIIGAPGLISPDLTWETVTSLNIGLDAALFDNALEVTFDWYDRTTTDMIGPAEALPEILGAAAPRENNAELQTRGWEAIVRWRGNIGQVGYTIGANISDNTTKVIEYNNPTNILSTFREGQELGEIWGFETVGFFTSDAAAAEAPDQSFLFSRWTAGDIQYEDLNGDGVIDIGENTADNPGDLKVIGNNLPRYAYGFNLGLNWKGFDLNVLLQGVAQRDFMFSTSTNLFWGFRGNQWQNTITNVHLDYWTEENPGAYFPKPYINEEHVKNTRSQTRYLQDASYMRLKNIQLTYTIPTGITSRIGLSGIQIFFSGENLATITDLSENFDPEALSGGWGEGKTYPLQKVLSGGINVGL